MTVKRVFLASDHAGFKLKQEVKKFLQQKGVEVRDLGALSEEPSDDYPDYVIPACEEVAKSAGDGETAGMVFGGTGTGECIAANKVKGIRAAVAYSQRAARLCRKHNDANVLCLGGRTFSAAKALKLVQTFLDTAFSGKPRHQRRLKKISDYENKQ